MLQTHGCKALMNVLLWLDKIYYQGLLLNEFALQIKKYNGCASSHRKTITCEISVMCHLFFILRLCGVQMEIFPEVSLYICNDSTKFEISKQTQTLHVNRPIFFFKYSFMRLFYNIFCKPIFQHMFSSINYIKTNI